MSYTKLVRLAFSTVLFSSLSFSAIAGQSNNTRTNEVITYVDGSENRHFQPASSTNDAKELGQSVEFEVYKITESGSTKAIYESPAGICQGFERNGVNYTHSTHHYVKPNVKTEYYGSVTGATIYDKKESQNLSYIPVYSISDKKLSKEIQSKEDGHLRERAATHVQEGKSVLQEVICR